MPAAAGMGVGLVGARCACSGHGGSSAAQCRPVGGCAAHFRVDVSHGPGPRHRNREAELTVAGDYRFMRKVHGGDEHAAAKRAPGGSSAWGLRARGHQGP